MTAAIAFDTHKFVKNLTGAGFTEAQAEVLANEQVNLLNSNLATKVDIEALRLSTKADIEALHLATKADIETVKAKIVESENKLLKWMIAALIAQGGLIVALIKLILS